MTTDGVDRNGRRPAPSRKPVVVGATAGVLHGVGSLLLWHAFEFESLGRMLSTEPLFLLYTLAGAFALGFVPGPLYVEWGTVSPSALTGVLLCLSAYGTWRTVRAGATPVDPTPFGWYLFLWAGLVVPVAGAGWIEARFGR